MVGFIVSEVYQAVAALIQLTRPLADRKLLRALKDC